MYPPLPAKVMDSQEMHHSLCNSSRNCHFQPSPNAPKTHLFPRNSTLILKKRSVLSRMRPVMSLVFTCQALFLSRSSQPTDSTPNRVLAPVRGLPPPICYPEYRASSFQRRTIRSGWPTSARCFGRMWESGIAWSTWACLLFNPCICKFLPRNIGGEGVSSQSPARPKLVKPRISKGFSN